MKSFTNGEIDRELGLDCDVQDLNTTKESKPKIEVIPQPPLLHNHGAPYHVNQKERPAHRLMVELAAKGYDNKEIAEITGRTTVNVNNALRQPHSQQYLVNEIKDRVSEDQKVVDFIRRKVLVAVETVAEIMEDEKASPANRIAAAEALLNRRYGKPNQPINSGNTVDLNHLSDAELAKMLPQRSSGTDTTTNA